VAGTYQLGQPVRTLVTADGVNLDLARATPCGLIVNELVTNVFKYAFPQGFDCMAVRGEPCTLRISLARTNGDIILSVRDNGIGIPAAFDPASAKSLGLKLVYFLARHQLRATTGVFRQNGTEFAIQFKEKVS
jgi:two-component sensor histidine kinase